MPETRGELAALALAAYNNEAPDDMLTLTVRDRIRHGTTALQAATGARPFTTYRQSAGDFRRVVADLFHLTSGRITVGHLWLAAREIRDGRPGEENVVHTITVLRAIEVDQCAALAAALIEAAQAHGIEAEELFAAARAQFTAEVELTEHRTAA